LYGGEEVIEIELQAAHGPRAGYAGCQKLFDPGIADGDERKFSGHKEGVGQDEQGYSDKLEQRKTVHLAVRIAFQGSGIRDPGSGVSGRGQWSGIGIWEPSGAERRIQRWRVQ
jgi:hypothetical protein